MPDPPLLGPALRFGGVMRNRDLNEDEQREREWYEWEKARNAERFKQRVARGCVVVGAIAFVILVLGVLEVLIGARGAGWL